MQIRSPTESSTSETFVAPLSTFAKLFLRIGVLGFGGPQAHIALLRSEIVDERQWVSSEQFDEGIGLCEALPGPASSQMAIYLGWLHRGWLGGIVSGVCFLLPGLLIVLVLSELWRNGQSMLGFTTALQTIQPVIAAIIWAFAWKLVRQRSARWQLITAALVMLGMLLNTFAGLPVPAGMLLLLAGLSRLICSTTAGVGRSTGVGLLLPLPIATLSGAGGIGATGAGLMASLFSVFFKTGLLVFGGGLVIIPLLERQVVELGWLSSSAFLDGVAIGQISPGPVVLTSSFVGYQAGWQAGGAGNALLGAFVATAGIFLPSFLFILVGTAMLQKLKQQAKVKLFLEGLLAGVPGAVAGAAVPLSLKAFSGGTPLIQLTLFSLATWFSIKQRMKPLALIGIALLIGLLMVLVG